MSPTSSLDGGQLELKTKYPYMNFKKTATNADLDGFMQMQEKKMDRHSVSNPCTPILVIMDDAVGQEATTNRSTKHNPA
jgi:hypothetical protein